MTTPNDDDVKRQWTACVARFADLLVFFATLKLSVSETQVALAMGLPNADALRRLLMKRELPPFSLLRDWYYVVIMLERDEAGNAVANWSLEQGSYPDVYYGFAQRVTGLRWGLIKRRGSLWAKRRAVNAWGPHMGFDVD